MSDETRKSKERSPNFPYISLELALDRAKQFYEMEKRGSAPFAVAAEHWHYSPSSSGALQTVAALKAYGLMGDEGGGSSRQVRLTELALRILLDVRPESKDRDTFKRQAALMPPVIAEIYQKFDGDLPSDANLNHHLVLERGFNGVTAAKAVEILKRNEALTNTAWLDVPSDHHKTSNDSTKDVVLVPNTAQIALQAAPAAISAQGIVIRNELIIGPTGDIQLRFTGDPTWETYDFLEKYLKLRKELLKATQGKEQEVKKPDSGAAVQ